MRSGGPNISSPVSRKQRRTRLGELHEGGRLVQGEPAVAAARYDRASPESRRRNECWFSSLGELRRQLAIAARHGGGEHRDQQEQGRFRPEVAADATDGIRRWSKSGVAFQRITPANDRHRWDKRE